MRNGRVLMLTTAMLAAGLCVSADEATTRRAAPKGELFRDGEYRLTVTALKSEAEVDLSYPARSEYRASLDGVMSPPEDAEAVCTAAQFAVVTAVNAEGKSLLKPAPRRGYQTTARADFNAFLDGLAAVKVDRAELAATPFSLDRLGLTADVIIAKTRESKSLPAVVMEDYARIGQGVQVRITSLNMSTQRKLTINAAYKRPSAGTNGAFLESIFVVDKDGNQIGGGRWTRGSGPFGATGTFTGEYELTSKQVHDSFRFVIVTASEKRTLRFDVKDVFQR